VAPLLAGVVALAQEAMPGTIRTITSSITIIVALFISSPFDVVAQVKRSLQQKV
jgi:hypothetical protein